MTTIDKAGLLAALRARLEAQLAELIAAQKSVQAGAFHPENKQEHSKDTRAIESAYLARGLAERVESLQDGIAAVSLLKPRPFGAGDPVGVGAVVTIEDEDGAASQYLIAPAGAGEKLSAGGAAVLVVTPQSPLGSAMIGRRCGDGIEVELPGGRMIGEVVSVR
ncbi:MAG TPA: GreA/GreB family elongation factor [Candidatus Limnocylindrales bacterium]|nr:GreA/GreB family elongation factor [Candidatus Limnocylindrales bacterium]